VDKIEVFFSVRKQGTARKTGNAYDMVTCQCKVTRPNGDVFVGEMTAPKGTTEVKPGLYAAVLALGRTMDGKIGAVIESLSPWPAQKAA